MYRCCSTISTMMRWVRYKLCMCPVNAFSEGRCVQQTMHQLPLSSAALFLAWAEENNMCVALAGTFKILVLLLPPLLLLLQVQAQFESTPVLVDTSASITAAYWQHHFRRLFHKQLLLLLLPTLCDLVGAALLNIGKPLSRPQLPGQSVVIKSTQDWGCNRSACHSMRCIDACICITHKCVRIMC